MYMYNGIFCDRTTSIIYLFVFYGVILYFLWLILAISHAGAILTRALQLSSCTLKKFERMQFVLESSSDQNVCLRMLNFISAFQLNTCTVCWTNVQHRVHVQYVVYKSMYTVHVFRHEKQTHHRVVRDVSQKDTVQDGRSFETWPSTSLALFTDARFGGGSREDESWSVSAGSGVQQGATGESGAGTSLNLNTAQSLFVLHDCGSRVMSRNFLYFPVQAAH